MAVDSKTRRELRRKLGTRVQRRAGVKSNGRTPPRQLLAKLINAHKRQTLEGRE